jgi:dynein heavy chain
MWRKWYTEEKPESCEMPKSMRNVSLFHRCLLLRAMRGDRLTYALTEFCTEHMGERFILQPPFDIRKIVPEMNPVTPSFFVIFPGVNPVPEVEQIAREAGMTAENGKFMYTSMGEGQEIVADKRLFEAGKNGYWALFANVHLMKDWMKIFERNLEIVLADNVHENFRCILTSEPPPVLAPLMEILPESVLQNSLKIANESPRDLKSNIKRGLSKFPAEDYERAKNHKEPEFKALLFGLCMFHSLILGRKKFGAQGWSRSYDFNDGDLRICGNIIHNYLEKYPNVPYQDLRYLFGDIMYGGHITDDWDRITNNTYLSFLIRPEILDNMQLTHAPGFRSPNPTKFER